jgi:hypothetical protein
MSYHVSVTFNKQLATWQPGVSDNFTSGPWFLKPEPNIQTACRSHRGSCAATHLHHHAWESETLVFGGIPEIAGWFTWTIRPWNWWGVPLFKKPPFLSFINFDCDSSSVCGEVLPSVADGMGWFTEWLWDKHLQGCNGITSQKWNCV